MGGYLGTPGSPRSSPAQARTDSPERPRARRPAQPLHRVQRLPHAHRAHAALWRPPARRPPNAADPARPAAWAVHEAWRRFPMERSLHSIVGPLPSDWWDSYLQRTIWSLRHPRAVGSPVTIRIAPPERRALPSTSPAEVIRSAGPPPSEKPPDPCAKETVLRALRQCKKGRVRFEEPLFPEGLHSERRSPDLRPSAFKPLAKDGVLPSFVPRPGPLRRSLGSWSSPHSLSKRPSCSSLRWSLASTHAGGPLGSRRNAITSSYSSSRAFSEPWKTSVLRASLQTPEWPVKKKEKGHQCHSPVSLESDGSPEASSSSGLPSSPGDLLSLTSPPQLGDAAPELDLGLGEKRGLQGNNKAGEETPEVSTDSVSETRSAPQPSLSLPLPGADRVPLQGTHPQLESLTKMQGSLLALPPAPGEAVGVAHSAKECSLLSCPGCSLSEPLPVTSADSRPTAAFTLLTPVSPTIPATDATWFPPTSQAIGTTMSPAALPGPSTLSGRSSPAPHLPAPAPLATASADPTPKPTLGLPPKSEVGGSLCSRTSVSATTSSSILTPTSQLGLGGLGPLETLPAVAPLSSERAAPASTRLLHGPAEAPSGGAATTPASTPRGSSSMPPLGVGGLNVSGSADNTCSAPCCSSLLGAACASRASATPATSFIFPAHPRAAVATVHTVTIFSQVLSSTVQTPPSESTAGFRGVGSAPSASAPVASPQPPLPSRVTGPASAFAIPSRSSPTPPFPLSLQWALGATGGQKQGAAQPALGASLSSPFILGNSAVASSTVTPAGAQLALGSGTQSPFGGLTASAPTCHLPAGTWANLGGAAAGVPFGQASTTGLGAVDQTQRNGARGSVFGSAAPPPFAFGGLVTPMDCGDSGVCGAGPDRSSSPGALSAGAVPGGTPAAVSPFGKGWSQSSPGLTGQSTAVVSGRASISAGKSMFGGSCVASLVQSTPVPGPAKTSSLNFGVPSPPAQACAGRGAFRSPASSFSIGAKSKTPKSREQGHSRRHHAHKK